jgi:hypothetical protein
VKARDPILIEVIAAIGAGRLSIAAIHDERDQELIEGMTETGGRVTINVNPNIVDTGIHEMLHRMRPAWSERAVRAKTTRLIRQLGGREIDTLAALIVSVAARAKR